jgi:hypothetical protein
MGGILIICGFLVKAFPDLIAGYNTMSETKKANVDIKGLSLFMRNTLVIIGLVVIGSYYFFRWLGIDEEKYLLIPAGLLMIGVIIMLIIAQRYDHNK